MRLSFILRVVISSVVLYVVLRFVDFESLMGVFRNLRWQYLVGALGLTIAIRVIMTLRWSVLLRSQGVFVSFARLLRIIMTSHSIGVLIPSSLGGDGLKALALSRETGDSTNAISSVVVDRVVGLVALAFIAFSVSLFAFREEGSVQYLIVSGCAFLGCLLSLLALMVLGDRIYKFCLDFKKDGDGVVLKKLKKVIVSFVLIGKSWQALYVVLGYSILAQFFRILLVFVFASALKVEVGFEHFAIFVPVIMLLMMLPISIAGIGLQEAAYFHFFGHLGMSLEEAVALSVFSYIDDIFWVVLGVGAIWTKGALTGSRVLREEKIGKA